MKRLITPIFWTVSLALIFGLARTYMRSGPLKVRASSGVSYTVVRSERGYDKSGALKYINEYVDAQRADSSVVHLVQTSIENRRTILFAAGDEIRTNELLGLKSTYRKRFSELPGQRDPEKSCQLVNDPRWIVDGTETIEGHPTVRQLNLEGGRKFTYWYALDAQCALVQQRFEHEDGVTTQSLTSLSIGEPASGLFEVASNLREVPPSSLYIPICKDGKCSAIPESVKQRLDSHYYALRSGTP